MSYQSTPADKFSFGLWTVANRGRDPFGEPVRDVLSPVDAVKMLGSIGAWGVNLHDNDLVPIDATASERDTIVKEFKQALRRPQGGRADGDGEPVHRSDLQGRRLHRQRPEGPPLRGAEDHGRDGSGRRARREDLRAVGRPRRHRDRRLPPRRRGGQAPARGDRLAVRVLAREGLRLQVRPRGQAERAARRHLHGDDRQLPRADPDAGASRDGRRQPRGRARDHGRPQLHARRRPGARSRQAVPHRSERSEPGPLRPGLPLRRRQPAQRVLPRQVPRGRRLRRAAPLRRARLPHRRTTTA